MGGGTAGGAQGGGAGGSGDGGSDGGACGGGGGRFGKMSLKKNAVRQPESEGSAAVGSGHPVVPYPDGVVVGQLSPNEPTH